MVEMIRQSSVCVRVYAMIQWEMMSRVVIVCEYGSIECKCIDMIVAMYYSNANVTLNDVWQGILFVIN